MSDLLKQLETIGQNASMRNVSLDSDSKELIDLLNDKDYKAAFVTPGEGISKEI